MTFFDHNTLSLMDFLSFVAYILVRTRLMREMRNCLITKSPNENSPNQNHLMINRLPNRMAYLQNHLPYQVT